ncbi:hypothetical protein HG536_0G03730 [Torulaspora globosa]|uniref:Cleavage/polyadenylation specificity factor A subunit N-terminal domain-containing protein n=1 Tax=Torulaspora globosa TaxID=48254 RepID=A0A7G3ZLX5_9SACH|nr:uncharacterized protein HG536_0G03730 [Torulaspora globosa]QLL34511.1 hypothetical protein HG536_0G03730 [Torulaspora globosa]
MLDTINETHWIIDVLLLGRRNLLIVEPRRFLRGVYSDAMKWDDMEVIKVSDDPTRPQSNNVAASLFWDPLLDREFIFLLKDSGTLEILDSELGIVDVCETGMEQEARSRFLITDPTSGKVFVNLTDNAIYSLDIRRTNDSIRFVKDGGPPRCFYETSGEILFYEAVWHIDLESGGDFITIAVLVDTYVQSGLSFEVIRQTQKGLRSKKGEWESLIELTRLVDLADPSSDAVAPAALKTVPNVGFFLFASNCTIFFDLPPGSRNSISGSKVTNYTLCNGLQSDVLNEAQQKTLRLQRKVILKQGAKGLEFTVFTNSRYAFSARLDLIFEHPEEYIDEWGELTVECAAILPAEAAEGFNNSVMNVITINPSTALIWSRRTGITFINLTTMCQIHSLEFSQPSSLYAGTMGYDISRLIACCGFDGGEGYIQSISYGYKKLLLHKTDIITLKENVLSVWLTKDDLWWKTESGLLMSKYTIAESNPEVSYVTWSGQKLSTVESVLVSVNIWDDDDGNFVWLNGDGVINWSMSHRSVKIASGKIPLDAQLQLACMKNPNGSYFTVVNVENKMTLVSDETVTTTRDLGSGLESSSVCDLFIIPGPELRHMLIGTTDGSIKLFDLQTFRVQATLRVGSKKLRFCGIPKSRFIFAYTEEDLILVEIDRIEGYNISKVHFTSTINFMSARNIGEIYIFDKKGLISCFEMPSTIDEPTEIRECLIVPSDCPTKFISFGCSNRLIVASSMRTTYNAAQCANSYSSCLLLFDIESQEQLFSYDLSDRYPQAIISDIVAIPYEGPHVNGAPLRKELLYAKRLTLSRCFLVALNFENAEDDTLDNLLLFSIDENKCTLDFHCSLKIHWVITALSNYHANTFVVSGECLQIFTIDYLLQENAFRISQASNSVPVFGYPIKVLGKIPNIISSTMEEGSKSTERSTTALVVNLLEGLQEYSVSSGQVSALHSSNRPTTYQIKPASGPRKRVPFLLNSTESNRAIIDCALVLYDQVFWIAVAYSDCSLEVYCIESGKDGIQLLNRMAHIKLDCQITALTTFGRTKQERPAGSENLDHMFSLSKPSGAQLFCVSTVRGGIYTLEESRLRLWLDTQDDMC